MFVRFLKYWLPLLIWMMLIFSASTTLGAPHNTSRFLRPFLLWLDPRMSDETYETIHQAIRKGAHFTEYAFLAFLAWRIVHWDSAFSGFTERRQYSLAILFCAIYASSDEFHQRFVSGRHPAVLDVVLDTFGAACALLAIWAVRRLLKAITPNQCHK